LKCICLHCQPVSFSTMLPALVQPVVTPCILLQVLLMTKCSWRRVAAQGLWQTTQVQQNPGVLGNVGFSLYIVPGSSGKPPVIHTPVITSLQLTRNLLLVLLVLGATLSTHACGSREMVVDSYDW
jgi:hypothetical protein